ncbi:hypothetical protein CEXT_673281 [Caerostris extrusa]|uniref:Uncharacterized protein n=1 Tax=Caerostris extrusa TaxID=172846 RepID=A0AAV4Y576_CAEEX|nr:hypothetical protein CEXT_673281 [Caerostris extrusa]
MPPSEHFVFVSLGDKTQFSVLCFPHPRSIVRPNLLGGRGVKNSTFSPPTPQLFGDCINQEEDFHHSLPGECVTSKRLTARCGHAPPASPGFQLNLHSSSNAWASRNVPSFTALLSLLSKGAIVTATPSPTPS